MSDKTNELIAPGRTLQLGGDVDVHPKRDLLLQIPVGGHQADRTMGGADRSGHELEEMLGPAQVDQLVQ